MNKILIIEDDQLVANVYRNKLAAGGFDVEVANDGQSGLEMVKHFKPQLIILDLMLPKVSGLDVMKKLRAQPEFEKLPIVVFSNTYLSNMVKEAWKAGATKCLSKANSTPKQVIECIRSALSLEAPAAEATAAASGAPAPAPAPSPAAAAAGAADPIQEFGKVFPSALAALRTQYQTLVRTPDPAERSRLLQEMFDKMHALTGGAGLAGRISVAQLTDAVEALLRELRDKPQGVNPSTLRTIASAIDFLDQLFKNGALLDFQKHPTPRILVVDDELLSRRAVTHALEKAKLQAVDMEDPVAAFSQVSDNAFDLIFLDADMPGMNGFELCAKIRTLPGHKKTPVVFVTSLTDFESRANSTMAGANDFIAKPFLFIELAVKALIYVLRGRLEAVQK